VSDGTEIGGGLGVPEERIGKDTDRAAGRADILDLAAGDPVIDGAPTDTDYVTRARNGNRLPFKHTFGTIGVH
jgi:hypothetical protein